MSTASQLQVVIHASQTQYHCDDDVAHSRMYASCETNMNHRLTLYNVTCLQSRQAVPNITASCGDS